MQVYPYCYLKIPNLEIPIVIIASANSLFFSKKTKEVILDSLHGFNSHDLELELQRFLSLYKAMLSLPQMHSSSRNISNNLYRVFLRKNLCFLY